MLNVGTLSPVDSTFNLPPNKLKFPFTGPLLPFISKIAPFVSSSRETQHTHLRFKTRHNGPSFLRVSAISRKLRKAGSEVAETDESDFDDFEDFDEDYDDGGGDHGDDEGMFIPFGNMKKWLDSKPRGFGEGKVYDTSVEDKLLQELEQSRQAQIANINKLKNEPVTPSSKKEMEKKKAPEDIPSGIRVRLFNLPKKKNIHRDLKSAFKGVPGIINIIPAVSGNKKTKDPICKGFAFVDFKSKEYATGFVQLFSRQSIAFGNVQKQIRCEMMNSRASKPVDEHSADGIYSDSKQTVTGFEEDPVTDFDEDEDSFGSVMEAVSDGSDPDGELDIEELEDVRENLEFVTVSELNGSNKQKQTNNSETNSTSSNQQKKIVAIEKKLIAKGDSDADFDEDEDSFGSVMEAVSDGSNPDGELDFQELEDVRENLEFLTVSELNGSNNPKRATNSSSSNQRRKIQAIEKNVIAKGKVKKAPKLDIPGSANRLKIKEKAVLTEVFSKYAVKAASTAKEES